MVNRAAVVVAFVVLAAFVAIYFAQPVLDSDLFFHLSYARQILERHTLILDHTQFSWSPASNRMIYCAWAAELFLYGLFRAFGLAAMFVLRYAVVLAIAVVFWRFARRTGRVSAAVISLLLIAMLFASAPAISIKPEIFSVLFFHILVAIYFRMKAGRGQSLYAVPVLFALWANIHGGMILAAPFLLATAIGEVLNLRFSPGSSLHRATIKRMLTAWALCGPAVLLNPYGWRYPAQLFHDYVVANDRPDSVWNAAHQSIFSPSGWNLVLPEMLFAMTAVLVALFLLRARQDGSRWRPDWALLLANVVYAPLFIVYLRSTFLWPAIFIYSVCLLAPQRPLERLQIVGRCIVAPAAAAAAVLITTLAFQQLWTNPYDGAWVGFGIGYLNPVVEAEYLAGHRLGPKIYNLFESGAYLTWRLFPQYQVMTDARSFPFIGWYQDLYDFSRGREFYEFLRKYPGDTAVIDLHRTATWARFAESPQWRPVYYGPAAAIFVRKGEHDGLQLQNADFRQIRNADAALRAFHFAMYIGDAQTGWDLLERVETKLALGADPQLLASARAYREGHAAIRAGNYGTALADFDDAFRHSLRGPRDRMIQAFLTAIEQSRGRDTSSILAVLNRLEGTP